jgi:hypothetical protein
MVENLLGVLSASHLVWFTPLGVAMYEWWSRLPAPLVVWITRDWTWLKN